jgi:CRISPR-associated protein Csm4
MNKLRLFKLSFYEPLHIHGTRSDYSETLRQIHSDTIYAAIMQAWAILGMDSSLDTIGQLETKHGTVDFTLSSLFPYATNTDGQTVHFLPRPKKAFDLQEVEKHFGDDKKKVKNVEWLDMAYFTEHISQTVGVVPKKGDFYDTKYLSQSKLTTDKFIRVDADPHASIPRDSQGNQTTPYTFERLHFAKGCGFYFLFEGTDAMFNSINTAFDLLQDEGLGTDRNLGNGQFTYEVKEGKDVEAFQNLFTVDSDYRTNLSLFMPNDGNELNDMLNGEDKNVGYELVKRGGWLTTEPNITLHKKAVFMFAEGSVFKTNKAITGLTTNVKPDFAVTHPVWRVGRSFFVPIKF